MTVGGCAAASEICKPNSATRSSWAGYYSFKGSKSDMTFDMTFNPEGTISGSGSDGVGAFTWSGTYEGKHFHALKKYTGKHTVTYQGILSNEGGKVVFSGTWTLPENMGGASDAFKMTETTNSMTVGGCSDNPSPPPALVGATSTEYSGCHLIDNEHDQYLDRQGVDCGRGKVLNFFGMTRHGCSGSNQQYEYKCGAATVQATSTVYSGCNPIDNKNLEYLDRQNVDCG